MLKVIEQAGAMRSVGYVVADNIGNAMEISIYQ